VQRPELEGSAHKCAKQSQQRIDSKAKIVASEERQTEEKPIYIPAGPDHIDANQIKSNDNSFETEINSPFPSDFEIASFTIVFERTSESMFIAIIHFKSFSNKPPVVERPSSLSTNRRNGSEFQS
jgi:hypothetical protein